jgi:hypothetical protein
MITYYSSFKFEFCCGNVPILLPQLVKIFKTLIADCKIYFKIEIL